MGILARLWHWLTRPHPSLDRKGQRRQARLLAALLLFLVPVAFLSVLEPVLLVAWEPAFQAVTFWAALLATGVLIAAYVLNRLGRFRLASLLLILGSTAMIYIFAAPYDTISRVDFLVFLVLFVLLSSVLLSLRETIIYVVLNGALMLTLPLLFPHLSVLTILIGPFNFLIVVSVAILLIAQYRNRLEMDRRAELVDREARYRALLETTFEGIVVVEGGVIADCNPGFASMFGHSPTEIVGEAVELFFAEASRGSDLLHQRTEVGHPIELTGYRRDGDEFSLEVVVRPLDGGERDVYIIGVRDVTERRRMAAQLQEYADHLEALVKEKVEELDQERAKTIHAAKLASLGEMATGIAHELNQPLTSILFEAEYLKMIAARTKETAEGILSPVAEELEETGDNIAFDVERCRRIIDHLRAFARKTGGYATSVDINSVIRDSFILVKERLKHQGVAIELDLSPNLPVVLADPNRLGQVFLNLITNSEQALKVMEQRVEDGEVEQVAYQKELEVTTYVEDGWVVVTVRDNGCGIRSVDQERVFEPFFTTKPVGEGVGLGLSISYGIVTQLGGEISFHSVENEGTTFTVRLPTPS